MTQTPELVPNRRPPNILRGRPGLYTAYDRDMALLNTPSKKLGVGFILLVAVVAPFFFDNDVVGMLARAFAAAIGAIGLNFVTGYAGQVSLGHAFFVGLGAYTAAILGGDPGGRILGYGLPFYIWLPAAGVVAALAGLLVGPIATRLRGLYLAIVTLGLVFIGEHIFKEARFLTGGVGVGRPAARPTVFGVDLSVSGEIFGIMLTRQQRLYFFTLFFLVVLAIGGRNLARSSIGRGFSAVRDRDVAAAIVGVGLLKYKVTAFTISSFYAGIAGALFFMVTGFVTPESFSLLLSVQYLAMILIGGVATISGSIMGALFIVTLPRLVQIVAHDVPFISSGPTGGVLTVFQLEAILYGLLIIGFLIAEPRGLFGIWLRIRNYWTGWPFSY